MNKIINLYLTIIFIHSTISDQSLQCGDWYTYKDVKCFKVHDNTDVQSYENAKNQCYQNEGSSLVSIASQEEQEFLFSLLSVKQKIVNDVWIGGQYVQNNFKWTDNSTIVNFTNWANGYPRSDSGYECVKMAIVEPYHGKWLNSPCNQINVVVCQKPQNWLFSYLQNTVMELRETVVNITRKLENTETELRNTKSELQRDIIKRSTEASPPGTVAFFPNSAAPLGWLKANGQSVSRTTYANLFASIGTTFGSGDGSTTFTLPDLRGEFIRSWSDGRDVDKDRTIGSFQWGSNVVMAGFIKGEGENAMANAWANQWHFAGATYDNGFENNVPTGVTRDGITLGTATANYITTDSRANITSWNVFKGSRPRNIALLVCIKY